MGSVGRVADALPGRAAPLGATPRDGGTNFAVASGIADAIELCLFDEAGAERRVQLPEYSYGVWHGFVPGVGPGQAYGYRVHGPWNPARGLRCNPAKLLLDPYAQAVHGEVAFGPEVFDYDPADQDAPSGLDSAGHVPRGIVTDAAFGWDGDEPPRRSMPDTIIYEAHVKGLTMRHPALGIYLDGSDDPDLAADGSLLADDDFLVLVNAWWEPLDFTIPPRAGQQWLAEIDSYDPAAPAVPAAAGRRRTGYGRAPFAMRAEGTAAGES